MDDPDFRKNLQCFKNVEEQLNKRIDVDFRDVIGACDR